MKCKDCEAAVKDFFKCEPGKYVCIGVKEPFVINDVNVECTQYPENRDSKIGHIKMCVIEEPEPVKPYVDDRGIYVPYELDPRYHRQLISRELFVEAYNKWIKKSLINTFVGQDDADDWSED
jgi:hypothetical protein